MPDKSTVVNCRSTRVSPDRCSLTRPHLSPPDHVFPALMEMNWQPVSYWIQLKVAVLRRVSVRAMGISVSIVDSYPLPAPKTMAKFGKSVFCRYSLDVYPRVPENNRLHRRSFLFCFIWDSALLWLSQYTIDYCLVSPERLDRFRPWHSSVMMITMTTTTN